jgi:hypothetical protein
LDEKGEIEMERNYSMMLKQLQMGFMSLTMKNVKEGEQCIYCWENNCGCGSKTSVKEDAFINFTGEELKYV